MVERRALWYTFKTIMHNANLLADTYGWWKLESEKNVRKIIADYYTISDGDIVFSNNGINGEEITIIESGEWNEIAIRIERI